MTYASVKAYPDAGSANASSAQPSQQTEQPNVLPPLASRSGSVSHVNGQPVFTNNTLRRALEDLRAGESQQRSDTDVLRTLRHATISVVALNQFSLNRSQPLSDVPAEDDPRYGLSNFRILFLFQCFCGFYPDSPTYNWWHTLRFKAGTARGLCLIWRLIIYTSILVYVCYPPVARPAFDSILSGNFVDLLRKEPPWLIGWLFLFTYPYCWFLIARIGGFLELQLRWYYMLRGQFMEHAWSIQHVSKMINGMAIVMILADLGMVASIVVRYPKEPILALYCFIMITCLGALLCGLETMIIGLLLHDKLGRQFGKAYLTRFNTFESEAAKEILGQHKKLTDGLERTHRHWQIPLSLSILGMFSGVVISITVALFSKIRSNQLFFAAYFFVFTLLLVLSLILPARITAVYRALVRQAEDMESRWEDAAQHTAFVQKLQLREGGYRVMGLTVSYALVAVVIYATTTAAIFLIYSLNLLGNVDSE